MIETEVNLRKCCRERRQRRDCYRSCSWAVSACPDEKGYRMYKYQRHVSPAAPLQKHNQHALRFSARFCILHTCIELPPVRETETRSREAAYAVSLRAHTERKFSRGRLGQNLKNYTGRKTFAILPREKVDYRICCEESLATPKQNCRSTVFVCDRKAGIISVTAQSFPEGTTNEKAHRPGSMTIKAQHTAYMAADFGTKFLHS